MPQAITLRPFGAFMEFSNGFSKLNLHTHAFVPLRLKSEPYKSISQPASMQLLLTLQLSIIRPALIRWGLRLVWPASLSNI
jgi:hypothetical protein